jgi:hypothetical protein
MGVFNKAITGLMIASCIHAHTYNTSCTSSLATQPTTPTVADASNINSSAMPTVIQRFQRLLVEGGSLLAGDALRKIIVFDFNRPEPVMGAMGGAVKAAVGLLSINNSSNF